MNDILFDITRYCLLSFFYPLSDVIIFLFDCMLYVLSLSNILLSFHYFFIDILQMILVDILQFLRFMVLFLYVVSNFTLYCRLILYDVRHNYIVKDLCLITYTLLIIVYIICLTKGVHREVTYFNAAIMYTLYSVLKTVYHVKYNLCIYRHYNIFDLLSGIIICLRITSNT